VRGDEELSAQQALDRMPFPSGRFLWTLLQNKTVQGELELLEAQQKLLTELPQRLNQERTRLRDALPESIREKTAGPRAVLDAAELRVYQVYLRETQQVAQQLSQAVVDESLLPHQLRRLKQLALQQQLPPVILGKPVAEFLQLTPQQRHDVQRILSAAVAGLDQRPLDAAQIRARQAARDVIAGLDPTQMRRLRLLTGRPVLAAAREFFSEAEDAERADGGRSQREPAARAGTGR
jgi:hypothetical protein